MLIDLNNISQSDVMNERQAAYFLRFARATLRTWRCRGRGPQFLRLPNGAIRYLRQDLLQFLAGERMQALGGNETDAAYLHPLTYLRPENADEVRPSATVCD
jgi:hypothetical protein